MFRLEKKILSRDPLPPPPRNSKKLVWLRGGRYASCVHVGGLSCSCYKHFLNILSLKYNICAITATWKYINEGQKPENHICCENPIGFPDCLPSRYYSTNQLNGQFVYENADLCGEIFRITADDSQSRDNKVLDCVRATEMSMLQDEWWSLISLLSKSIDIPVQIFLIVKAISTITQIALI